MQRKSSKIAYQNYDQLQRTESRPQWPNKIDLCFVVVLFFTNIWRQAVSFWYSNSQIKTGDKVFPVFLLCRVCLWF